MANWSNPTLTSPYNNFVTEVKDRDTDCATFFDGSSSINLPTGTKRWNSSSNKFEKWSGTAWGDLAASYAINISGTAANITGTLAVANGGTGVTSSTGSGSVVLSNAPTFSTSITAPILYGGSGTTSTLRLRPTSGVGTTGADIIFENGNNGATEVARFTHAGDLLLGTTSSLGKITAYGDFTNLYGMSVRTTNSTATAYMVNFINSSGTQAGYIAQTSSTAVLYSTSSDYRLKENIRPMTGALAKVAALRPVTYTWRANGQPGEGFIAHELQAVIPDAVVGQKDAVDPSGAPRYQGVDTSFIVATLVAAIQELQAEVAALKQSSAQP